MARQPFNNRWAQSVEDQNSQFIYQQPQPADINLGWEGGQDKDPPAAGWENWWHNRVDSALQQVERQGAMDYHPQAIYSIGAPAKASDGNYYESIQAQNIGNNPLTAQSWWRFIGPSLYSANSAGDLKYVAHDGDPDYGWLSCNGAVVLRNSFSRLFSKIGTRWNTGGESGAQFRLPDFRDRVLRIHNGGRGIDVNRLFGTYQSDALQMHNHFLPTSTESRGVLYGIRDDVFIKSGVNPSPGDDANSTTYPNPGYIAGDQAGSMGRWAQETRMTNATANVWIKY